MGKYYIVNLVKNHCLLTNILMLLLYDPIAVILNFKMSNYMSVLTVSLTKIIQNKNF